MKKIISFICIVTLLISSIVMPANVKASKIDVFEVTAKPDINKITLRWENQEDVSYYKVYRVIQRYHYMSEKKKDYKCIATLTNDKTEYVDKDVKRRKRYCYFIRGYKENGEKDKIICTSYLDWDPLSAVPGLDKPVIRGAGYSKKNKTFKFRIVQETIERIGMEPTGYDVYRKEVGKKQYKKIKVKKLGKHKLADENAQRGKIYKYKVKSYLIVGKKKYYSKMSDVVTLDNTNYVGKFKVKLLYEKNKETSTLIFRLKSNNKYNANTRFFQGEGVYLHQLTESDTEGRYHVKLVQYSLDNKTWKNMPKKGVVLKAKETIYLKTDIYDEESKNRLSVRFGENMPYESYMLLNGNDVSDPVEYKNSKYYTETSYDFVTGYGRSHQEGD